MNKKGTVRLLALLGTAALLMAAAAACGSGENAVETKSSIQGVSMETYEAAWERHPVKILSMEEMSAQYDSGGGGGGAGAGAAGGGPPPAEAQVTPAIYIENGKYVPEKSRADLVSAGEIGDSGASGVRIVGDGSDIGGIYVTGEGVEYTLSDADIELAGDVTGLGGVTAGAAATGNATLILKNCNITASGANRNTTSSKNNGTLKVYNCTLTGHDNPFDPTDFGTDQKTCLEINGNNRTTITIGDSSSYFYDSTIIADGWGALSTDAGGVVYLEANNCKVQTVLAGYTAYADIGCTDVFNNCEFDSAAMAIIAAGQSQATFANPTARCKTYFALMHCIRGSYTEITTLDVVGGDIACGGPAIVVKSQNVDVSFDGTKLVSDAGVLIKSMFNIDPMATKTYGNTVYGIHANFRNMDLAGDLVHEDPDRVMSVVLTASTLKGAVKKTDRDIFLTLDSGSRWTATADSKVTLVGGFDISQIDAPEGVTIEAAAGEAGTYTLAGGGTLVLTAL